MKDFKTSLVHVGHLGKIDLNLDVHTHWNSIYLISRSIKEVKHAFNYFNRIYENYKWCPS